MSVEPGQSSLDRMVRAVEMVCERLPRVAAALDRTGVAYAVADGNAVALWVSRVDESAARNTRDAGILIRRSDFEATRAALSSAGFLHRHSAGIDLFLDGPDAKARDAVRVVFANEKVRPHEPLPNPDVADAEDAGAFRVLAVPALVQIELTAFRDKDRTHLHNLIDVGLLDASWYERFPPELAERLRLLLENPEV